LAVSAAQALQLLRALTTARDQALRDGLTGAYNRRFLDEVLPKEVEQARRREAPLSVLMLDIDHFKRFNDSFGHEVGDRVLAVFARTLQARLRSGDFVARYGGEEFTAVLPGAGLEEARLLAERLRAGLEALELGPPDFPEGCRITASLGVAAFPEHGADGEALLQSADRALYLAKGQGRNRVVAAPS
jgi:diguanylate cyclase (GGDEF)-like protein